jgi:hypothetical protein
LNTPPNLPKWLSIQHTSNCSVFALEKSFQLKEFCYLASRICTVGSPIAARREPPCPHHANHPIRITRRLPHPYALLRTGRGVVPPPHEAPRPRAAPIRNNLPDQARSVPQGFSPGPHDSAPQSLPRCRRPERSRRRSDQIALSKNPHKLKRAAQNPSPSAEDKYT